MHFQDIFARRLNDITRYLFTGGRDIQKRVLEEGPIAVTPGIDSDDIYGFACKMQPSFDGDQGNEATCIPYGDRNDPLSSWKRFHQPVAPQQAS